MKTSFTKKFLRAVILSTAVLSGVTAQAQFRDSVYSYIVSCGIQHPAIVMQQVMLETGRLATPYLMKRNNLFAFRITEEYMHFETWKQSVEYYKRWQDRHYKNPTEDYYSFLQRIKYSGSADYVSVLKRVSIKKD
ncbi:MAG: hypothetical protein NTY88_02955 [Bacteroidetes bacterium]|nr:hypothetical protein [Bacteroidota bacterium]